MEPKTMDSLAEGIDSLDELKKYSNAQYSTIQKLVKRISILEKENQELKQGGQNSENQSILSIDAPKGVSDEEVVCILELNKLKNLSLVKELTLEECRKVETYVRTLSVIRQRTGDKTGLMKDMSDKDLLEEFTKPDGKWSIS